VLLLGAIILAGMFYPLFQAWRRKRNKQMAKRIEKEPVISLEREPVISLWAPIFTLFIVAFFGWSLWEAREWWFRARLFPWAIGFAGLALALTQLYLDARSVGKANNQLAPEKPRAESRLVRSGTLAIAVWILGFFIAIWLLGFPIAVPLMTLAYLKISGGERWPLAIALTTLAWSTFYRLFGYALNVPFPRGFLFEWL
jgi:hypothetical protein